MTGANRPDEHLRGVVPGRDFAYAEADVRTVEPGDTIAGEAVTIEPAIEIGNIFKLGTRYSEPLGAELPRRERAPSSRSGWAPTGSARRGSWPPRSSSSPTSTASPGRARWRRSPCTSSRSARPARPSARPPTALYETLRAGGWRSLYDDRDLGPGEKFADAELLGCPLRLTVGRRSLESGEIEVQVRRGRAQADPLSLSDDPAALVAGRGRAVAEPPLEPAGDQAPEARARWRPPRLTFRRLSGLDRSGPPPPQTQAGAPLRPWTIPNAIGFVRLALIPVFLVVALSSDDGQDTLAAVLFAVIGWGDYADGIAARVTRQYSRLGALMDPVTDRLLVVSGVVVCWHFELLPRWALAVLAARELLMLRARPLRAEARRRAAHQLARPARRRAR